MKLFGRPDRANTVPPAPLPVDPSDVEALLVEALGTPLADAARIAETMARSGLPGGRVGKSYASSYEANRLRSR